MSAGMSGTWGTGGVRCRMKRSKREGDAYCYFTANRSGFVWVNVLWDDEDAPTVCKQSDLLFKHLGERTFKPEDSR